MLLKAPLLILMSYLAPTWQLEWVQVAGSNPEWIQLPSLDAPLTLTPIRAKDQNSSLPEPEETRHSPPQPSVVSQFIVGVQNAHQQLRAVLWPRKQQPQTITEKVSYLTNLRNHILNYIARSINALKSQDITRARRERRGTGWGSGDQSEIGFPSLEVALLTLSFLIFAVFLVNIVLVLFSNIFGTTSSSTSNTNTQALGRRRREVAEHERLEAVHTAKVLEAIELFPQRLRKPWPTETSQTKRAKSHCSATPRMACEFQTDAAYGLHQVARFLLQLKL